ncbi:MAG: X2-like carbohydrate binding domain-containing protein, partial [Bacteroidales bacterium]|nr:X2-like carbohydrate binding domain-containing protein [Bacteroidales bacterium]
TATVTVNPAATTYESTEAINFDISVIYGTSEVDAISQLASTVKVYGTGSEEGDATISWTFASYDGNIPDDYSATGVLTLPAGWTGDPADVTATVTVLELISVCPFATNFTVEENWNLITAAGTYGEKAYEESGWHFHALNTIRDASDTYDGSSYTFRNRDDFTITNQGPVTGMTGFRIHIRNWSVTADRIVKVSTNGGVDYDVIETINASWFENDVDYFPLEYYFTSAQSLAADQLVIVIEGQADNVARMRIGGFEALDTEPIFNVTYFANSESATGEVPVDPTDYSINDIVTVLGQGTLALNGYTFGGWNTQADGEGTTYQEDETFSMANANVDLYAIWSIINYTITYNLDGGENHVDNPATFTVEDLTFTLGDASKEGYTFEGWYNNAEFTGDPITQISSAGNLELWAKFKIVDYTITYYLDKGDNHVDNPATFTVDDLPLTLKDASKEGHTFEGWYNNDEFTGEAVNQISTIGNVELWAKFEPIPTFPITFNVDMSTAGDFTKAYIAGDADFGGYYTGLQELTESGAWYTVTLNLPDGTYEYKYYTNDIDGAEAITASRSVTVAGEAKTINELWGNTNAGAAINPTARDYDLTNPANVTTTITWYVASAIEKINDGTADLTVTDHYTLVGNTLTVKNEYLATKLTAEGQSVPLEITFDAGEAITFTVNATESAIVNAEIEPAAATFDKHNPTDLVTEITWNDATVINKIELDATELVLDTDYTLVGTTLTLKEAYLAGLDPAEGAELVFTITFDVGNAATYTVTVLESAAIVPVTATYDILYPQDIAVEVTWNDAASIDQITYDASVLATPADYTLDGSTLTIQQAFFERLTIAQGDEVNLDIAFNAGADAKLAVSIIKSATLDTEVIEFYENWPNEPVEITITWNSAAKVVEFQLYDDDTEQWTILPPVTNEEKFWEVIDIDGETATLKIYLANAPAKSAGAKEGDQYTGSTELTRVVFDVGQPAEMDIVMKVKVFNLTFVVMDTEGTVIDGAQTTLELIDEEGGFQMSEVNSFIVEAGAAYKYTATAEGYTAVTKNTVEVLEDMEIIVVLEEETTITFPFATKFENADAWAGGTWTGYNEKTYIDEGWHFHTTSAVRGDASESFGGSSFSFRDRGIFTVKNLAPIEGMKGFSFQLRDWMYSTDNPEGVDRDIQVSFDGGTTWEVVATINKAWFDEYQVYQEFIHTFSELKNFDAEKLVIQIVGGTGSNDSRINIGQFKAFDIIAPTITPESAEFDLYVPADIDITIKWGDATQLTSVKVDGADLATEFYTLDGSTLTIKQAFFANAEYLDVYMFDLTFDTEHKLTVTVSVIDTEYNHASIDPLTAEFDVFAPADVSTTITWNDATELVSVSVDGTALTKDVDFELVENTLTILKEYFANVNAGDEITFTLEFDVGVNLKFRVTVIDNTPIDIETLAELRTKAADGTAYRYTGEAVIVAMDGNRNRKFLQDATAAIMIDDNNGIITTEYQLYDVITNVTGRISIFNSMVQFVPIENTAAATQNTPVEPVEFALANVASADQAKLIVLKGVTFKALTEGQLFENSKNYTVTDGITEFVVRTDFKDIDLIGKPIPQSTADVAGVVLQYQSTLQLIPRMASDIYAYSTDATLQTFTLGGLNVLDRAGLLVDDPDTDEGATLFVDDFTDFKGIAIAATDDAATVLVKINDAEVAELDYADQVLADGDVVVATVTAEDGTIAYYKVTITGENRVLEITGPALPATYHTGDEIEFTWSATNITHVNIYVVETEVGGEAFLLNEDAPVDATDGTYTYTVVNGDFGTYTVRIEDATDNTFFAETTEVLTVVDDVSPDGVVFYPAWGDVDVPVSFTLSIQFDEDIEAGTGKITINKVSDDSEVLSFTETDFTISYDVLTISVTGLAFETEYYILADAGVVKDLSGNLSPVLDDKTEWTFTTMVEPIGDLFISEYIEGKANGNNRAIELYNPTSSTLDLSNYVVKAAYNGGGWAIRDGNEMREYILPLTGTLDAGKVYVIYNSQADDEITSVGDLSLSYGSDCDGCRLVSFTGNDAIGLFKKEGEDLVLIDVIGVETENTAWAVAGVENATQDHTLVRKSDITIGNTNWAASAGTNADDSEWIVYPADELSFIGWHGNEPTLSITSPADGSTIYDDKVTVSFAVYNFQVGDNSGGDDDGYVVYKLNDGDEVELKTTDDFELTGLALGEYTLTMWLVDNNGDVLNPEVSRSVTFTIDEVSVLTIYEVRYTTEDPALSPYQGEVVTTKGIVTGAYFYSGNERGFFIQDGVTAWNGILVYTNTDTGNPAIGDEVQVTGKVDHFYNFVQLTNPTFEVLSSDNDVPEPKVLTTAEVSAQPDGYQWQSMLLRVEDAECTDNAQDNGRFLVNDGSGVLSIDPGLYAFDPATIEVGKKYNITGFGLFAFSEHRLAPRNASDIELATSAGVVTEENINVYPNPFSQTLWIDNVQNARSVVVVNLIGQQVMNMQLHGDSRVSIPTENLPSGVYLISVEGQGGERTVRRVIKR